MNSSEVREKRRTKEREVGQNSAGLGWAGPDRAEPSRAGHGREEEMGFLYVISISSFLCYFILISPTLNEEKPYPVWKIVAQGI